MWTLNWILCESIWKRWRFHGSVNEPLHTLQKASSNKKIFKVLLKNFLGAERLFNEREWRNY